MGQTIRRKRSQINPTTDERKVLELKTQELLHGNLRRRGKARIKIIAPNRLVRLERVESKMQRIDPRGNLSKTNLDLKIRSRNLVVLVAKIIIKTTDQTNRNASPIHLALQDSRDQKDLLQQRKIITN